MSRRTGFTVVEVIIVMAIMAILLAIGTVSFRSYQVSTRDKTREGDIATIQNYLESLYPRELRDSSNNIIKSAGSYPAHVVNGAGGSTMTDALFDQIFSELPDAAKKGPLPGEKFVSAGVLQYGSHSTPLNRSMLMSYTSDYNTHKPSGHANGAYAYFAINRSGNRCITLTDECQGYIIMYHLEGQPLEWKVVEKSR